MAFMVADSKRFKTTWDCRCPQVSPVGFVQLDGVHALAAIIKVLEVEPAQRCLHQHLLLRLRPRLLDLRSELPQILHEGLGLGNDLHEPEQVDVDGGKVEPLLVMDEVDRALSPVQVGVERQQPRSIKFENKAHVERRRCLGVLGH
jgi:hypothetical protein